MKLRTRGKTTLAWSLWLATFGCCAAGLLVTLANADPKADADLRPATSVWEVPVPAADAPADASPEPPREILALAGWVRSPAYSADGRLVASSMAGPRLLDNPR